jgi:CRISPR-associated protein (TIGR03986 family)
MPWEKGGKKYSGKIECTLETLTPLFIPRGKDERDIEFFSYDYTSASPKPIIPGSSIRGVVRSVFEALTNGCLSTVDDETLLYRRTNEPKTPGLIVKNGDKYELYRAERVMLNTRGSHKFGKPVNPNDYKTGAEVYIKKTAKPFTTSRGFGTGLYGVDDITHNPGNGYFKGYVLIGEAFQRKHHDAVFINKNDFVADVTDSYPNLEKVWKLYQTKANGGVNEGQGEYRGYLKADTLPVFYTKASQESNNYYLSPACITKEVFYNTIRSILEKQGAYQPCDSKTGYCDACRLFGTVDGESKSAIASRVSFRDATPVNPSGWYDTPRKIILGGPKITATEFYLQDTGADTFTYDYDITYTNSTPHRNPNDPKLRGRKFYWHSSQQENASDGANEKMKKTIHPVKEGEKFTFFVNFDRLTADELSKLKLALALLFGDGKQYAHKLGHAKPIGYGSVIIGVDKGLVFDLDADFNLTSAEPPNGEWQPDSNIPISELKKMLSWSEKPGNVQYPRSDGKIYNWFGKNKSKENSQFQPKFSNVLPTPLSPNLKLSSDFARGGGNRRPVVPVKKPPVDSKTAITTVQKPKR